MKIFAIEHEPFESTRISPLRKKISSAFKTAFSRVILRRKSVYDKYFADFKKALVDAKKQGARKLAIEGLPPAAHGGRKKELFYSGIIRLYGRIARLARKLGMKVVFLDDPNLWREEEVLLRKMEEFECNPPAYQIKKAEIERTEHNFFRRHFAILDLQRTSPEFKEWVQRYLEIEEKCKAKSYERSLHMARVLTSENPDVAVMHPQHAIPLLDLFPDASYHWYSPQWLHNADAEKQKQAFLRQTGKK